MPVIIYSTSKGDEYKIDEISQRLLVHFAIRGETELDDAVGPVGAESKDEIIKRVKHQLGPDAVEFIEVTSQTRTFDDEIIDHYGLTELGDDFVHNHIDDLAAPADLRRLSQRVGKLEMELLHQTAVDGLRTDIEDLRCDLQDRISELENQLDELESSIE